MAMLRLGSCPLNLYQFRISNSDSPDCSVDETIESVGHFLLQCSRYSRQRVVMMDSIRQVLPPGSTLQISESVLLGGHGVGWPQYQHVADAVVTYVLQTQGAGFTGF